MAPFRDWQSLETVHAFQVEVEKGHPRLREKLRGLGGMPAIAFSAVIYQSAHAQLSG
jgi:hypothetical protein